MLSKIHSYRLLFRRFCQLGRQCYYMFSSVHNIYVI